MGTLLGCVNIVGTYDGYLRVLRVYGASSHDIKPPALFRMTYVSAHSLNYKKMTAQQRYRSFERNILNKNHATKIN